MIRPENIPFAFIRREVEFPGHLARGKRGLAAKRVQEWCTLAGIRMVVDGRFGPATEEGVRLFQRRSDLPVTGAVDEATWSALTGPMLRVLEPIEEKAAGSTESDAEAEAEAVPASRLGKTVVTYAEQHLAEHPREVGGANRGPWVRLYMEGNEGPSWLWCAGFTCFLLQQATHSLDEPMPIKRSISCDTLALRAQAEGRFVRGTQVPAGLSSVNLRPGTFFLSRRTASDWTHVGIVTEFNADHMVTIEGNTNDEGSREGFEVCLRIRGYGDRKDYIRVV